MSDTSEKSVRLDSDELLHLAIQASESSNHDSAISYLKRAIEIAPENPAAYYMLGAEHAGIGMYDRATADMQKAVDLGISIPTAHFQLGLLHITSGRLQEAIDAWKPLDELSHDHPLYLFKTGLLHLAKDEFSECAVALRKGIEANHGQEDLNRDMQNILDQVTPLLGNVENTQQNSNQTDDAPSQHVFLSAYQQKRDDV